MDGRHTDGETMPVAETNEGIRRRALLNSAGVVGGAVLAASLLPSGAVAADVAPITPISAARFSLRVDGVELATFNELAGITSEVEPAEYLETSDTSITTNKLPGKLKPPTLTLKRGLTGGMELWAWHEAARAGNLASARKDCNLVMFDDAGSAVARYHLENAWPSKLELAGLKAGSSQALTETVTLVCESLQRVTA